MAITRIGGTQGGAINAGAVTLTLPTGSMSVDDLIIVAYGNGDNDATNPTLAMTTAGYTNALGVAGTTLHGNSATGDASLAIFYKFWDGVETTAVCAAGGTGTDSSSACALQVFRGVSKNNPLEVTSKTATGTSGGDPNPPSISGFTEASSAVVIAGVVANATAPLTLTAPTNYTTNPVNGTGTDTYSASTGLAYRLSGAADPEDPAVFADSGAGVGWAAATLVLKSKVSTQAVAVTPVANFVGTGNIAKRTTKFIATVPVANFVGTGNVNQRTTKFIATVPVATYAQAVGASRVVKAAIAASTALTAVLTKTTRKP